MVNPIVLYLPFYLTVAAGLSKVQTSQICQAIWQKGTQDVTENEDDAGPKARIIFVFGISPPFQRGKGAGG